MITPNRIPKLYPLNKDLNKTWFIKYWDAAGRPAKMYGKINSFDNIKDRMKEVRRLIAQIGQPGKEDLRYKEGLIKNLSDVLEFRRPLLEKKSYQDYYSIIKKFATWYNIEHKKNKSVHPAEFVKDLFDAGLNKNYMRKIILVLGSLFKALKKKNLYGDNPFEDIRIKKVKGRSKLPFAFEQRDELKSKISVLDPQLWFACRLLYYTYLRPEEVRLLKVGDIDFYTMVIYIREDVAKDDDCETIIIPKQLEDEILKLKEFNPDYFILSHFGVPGPKPLSKNSLNNRHREFITMLNYGKRFTLYSWVHTGIKEAAMSNIPIKQLQMQKRHYSLDMFNEYLKDLRVEDNTAIRNNFPTL